MARGYRRAIEDHHFYAAARAVELQAKLARMAPASRSSRFPAPVLIEGVVLPQSKDAKASNCNEPGK